MKRTTLHAKMISLLALLGIFLTVAIPWSMSVSASGQANQVFLPMIQNGQVAETASETFESASITLGEPISYNTAPKTSTSRPEDTQKLTPSIPEDDIPLPTDEKKPTQPENAPLATDGWTTVMSEGFEGAFPNGAWRAFDNDGVTNGEYYWDDDDYLPYSGGWSAWAANGGANSLDPQVYYYPDNMQSWIMYGPFDLSNTVDAELLFSYWNQSETNYDYFGWYASANGTNFYGSRVSGDSAGWKSVNFDLTAVPGLGSLLGDNSVWIAFVFTSDSNIVDDGAFVDSVLVQKSVNSNSCPGQYKAEYFNNRTLSGTPTFTRCEAWPIAQNWGNGGPGNGVGPDNFSVRWTGTAYINAGRYNFTAAADDGLRVWFDNGLILDAWRDQSVTTFITNRQVSAGYHTIKVEYYEKGGDAVVQFRWLAAQNLISNRAAFDKCEIPSLSQLQTWWNNSPYREINLYIGGSARACGNSGLTSSWVAGARNQGWNFIPTWVGPQAPCTGFRSRMSSDANTAYQQGRSEADKASNAAKNIGLTPSSNGGTIIYYDMESYPNNSSCRNTVKSFMNGWVSRLHELGNFAGGYGSACASYLDDWSSIRNVPDDIWPAHWIYSKYNSNASVWNVACISNSKWVNHQRIRQYAGGHGETWGGVTFNIDSDIADGLVAGTNSRGFAAQALSPEELAASDGEAWLAGDVQDFQLLSPAEGWAVTVNRLFWTNNHGEQWADITPSLADMATLRSGYFLDTQRGWVIAASAPDFEGRSKLQVAHTADQGKTWEFSELPFEPFDPNSTQSPVHVTFIDPQTGWVDVQIASGSNFSLGTLFHTQDGGKTWEELPLPIGGPVRFVTAQIGWVAGGVAGNELYVTRDGGHRWNRMDVSAQDGDPSAVKIFYDLPTFQNEQHGTLPVTIAGSQPRVEFYATNDSGLTWTLTAKVPLSGGAEVDSKAFVQVLGSQRWFVTTPDQPLYTGSNSEINQATLVTLSGLPGVTQVEFIDDLNGWAYLIAGTCSGTKPIDPYLDSGTDYSCLRQSLFLKTADGGLTWTEIRP